MIEIANLHIYPVKSCGGLTLSETEITANGPRHDRAWMFVDEEDNFVTQRSLPRMALIQPELTDKTLILRAPGKNPVELPVTVDPYAERHPVTVWRDTVAAADMGDEVAAWASGFLETGVRLVAMPRETVRAVDPTYARRPAQVGFADGFPLLLISEASLEDLNRRTHERGEVPVPMMRFRPNLVVRGTDPFAEDDWTRFEVGGITFEVVKPCARCKITTVDPATGVVPNPKEPLGTLATFRRRDDGAVLFGQNIIHDGQGTLRGGDTISLL